MTLGAFDLLCETAGCKFVLHRLALFGEPDKSADCRKGLVTNQNPTQGAELNEGDTVTINVCTGPETVEVPNLVGKPFSEVADALTKLGLTPEESPVDSSDGNMCTARSGKYSELARSYASSSSAEPSRT